MPFDRNLWEPEAVRRSILAPTALAVALALLLLAALPHPLEAQSCHNCGFFLPLEFCPIDVTLATDEPGCDDIINCVQPKMIGPFVQAIDQGNGSYAIRFAVDVRTPYNSHKNAFSNGKLDIEWWEGTPSGFGDLCENNNTDRTVSFVQVGSATCADVALGPVNKGTYSVRANICGGPGASCGHWEEATGKAAMVTAQTLGCLPPREWSCPRDPNSCNPPCLGPAGGASPAGGGPGAVPGNGGPGALLRYAAGGAGSVSTPGAAAWREALGQGWSHDYASTIVEVSGTEAWLLTPDATFRHFTDTTGDGSYDTVSPVSEKRTLARTATGWELTALDGTVTAFDSLGRLGSITPPEGSVYATEATYDAGTGKLSRIDFPDGRAEGFSYGTDGKLASITEVGVDGVTTRAWAYQWAGQDLVRIDRPDGTAWELFYEDTRYPGYMTRMDMVADVADFEEVDAENRQVEAAWSYDDHGNVLQAWKGDPDFGGPDAVETWTFSYDDPALPTVTTVTDPAGEVATYTFDAARGSVHERPKLAQVSGACPLCSFAANSQLDYTDPDNPFRPTEITDGRGTVTMLGYDDNGQTTSRTEDFDGPEERTTYWTYDGPFPALVTKIEVPSVVGGTTLRITDLEYDPAGNPTKRTISGVEDGSAFSLATDTAYNAAGQPTAVDLPGYETAPTDETTWSYTPDDPSEPDRNGLLPFSRTDPLVGTTGFGYDAFKRRTSVTDPNGVETTTGYDALGRVTEVTQGTGSGSDLVTTHVYDALGRLSQTILPRGNAIEYGYDPAGRLITIERKPDKLDESHGERTRYVLDAAGNREEEHLERWDPVAETWETLSTTRFEYASRCQVGSITRGYGSATPSTTHFAHDCNGNVERVWDENHPRFDAGGTELPPTQTYAYDPLDRLVSVTEPWGGAGDGDAVTVYQYDVQDHLVSVTDAEGNVTSYTYSDRDLLTEEISPVSGTTTHTYNDHGELTGTTDARGVTVTRTVDAADRVTAVDSPDDSLDTSYEYAAEPAACGGASFSVGRLDSITRDGEQTQYCYDRFGRTTRDGDLTFEHDGNGNRTGIGYPGGVTSTVSYDFADRPTEVTVTTDTSVDHPVVSGAAYLPSGPLTALTLGNGLTEIRGFDARYQPASISLDTPSPGHSWTYTTDAVGNVLAIDAVRPCSGLPLVLEDRTVDTTETFESCSTIEAGAGFSVLDSGDVTLRATDGVALADGFSVGTGAGLTVEIAPVDGSEAVQRSYGYQDVQYFLTGADGPWGTLDWTYDRIGNRLTEARDGSTPDTYVYTQNTATPAGNTPILDEVQLGIGGTHGYTWGAGGHLEEVAAGANVIDFQVDAAGRQSGVSRDAGAEAASFTYDGRSFLTAANQTAGGSDSTDPVYDSSGLLHALRRKASSTADEDLVLFFYLAGRPVAQLEIDGTTGAETWAYLTTDHLGTPLVATDQAGSAYWQGGFEPFGGDYQQGTAQDALANGIHLRLPGQWEDTPWSDAASGAGVFYNVHRWYLPGVGAYSRPDPINLGRLLNLTPLTGLSLFTEYELANFRIGNPKLESLYGYGAANPLGLTDPDGRVAPLVCPLIPPALAALGKAVAATAVVVSAAAAGVIANDWINEKKDCDDCDDEPPSHCDDLLEVDRGVCGEFARRGDTRSYRACMSQAMTRYSECLRFGRPLSPLFPSPFSD